MLQTWTSRPAAKPHAIAFCVDRGAYPLAESIGRLIKGREPEIEVVICVEGRDIPLARLMDDGVLRYAVLNVRDRLHNLPTTRSIPLSSYARLLLPEAFSDTYERILYLDTDILPIGGGLSKLFTVDMGGAAVATAPDLNSLIAPPDELRSAYRNAGIQLLDCTNGRAGRAFERVLAFAHRNVGHLPQHDQTALNAALGSEMALLSPRWNFIHTSPLVPYLDSVKPRIVHFVGHDKPWISTENEERMKFHDVFIELLEEVFAPGELDEYGLWGTEAGGKQKYRNRLMERLSRWNRRRNLARKARRHLPVQPVPAEVLRRFIAEADIP